MATITKKSAASKTRKGRKTAKEVLKGLKKDLGTIQKIVALGKKGFDQKEIIAAGFNKNTVYRQYREQVAK